MTNFELIDDYLSNRLTQSENASFEQEITTNSSLRSEVEFQKNILEGIKKARAAELKAMLNNTPIGSPVTSTFSMLKMAAGIVGAGLLITSLYYYYKSENLKEVPNLSTSIQDSVQDKDSASAEQIVPTETLPETDSSSSVQKSTEIKSTPATPRKQEVKPSTSQQSKIEGVDIELIDPTDELSSENAQEEIKISEDTKSRISPSPIQVQTFSPNKKYDFHYQFLNGKLLIYGPFDKNLYEILEINGEKHSIFLFYEGSFYYLDEKKTELTKLSLIKDNELLKKLKEYRGK